MVECTENTPSPRIKLNQPLIHRRVYVLLRVLYSSTHSSQIKQTRRSYCFPACFSSIFSFRKMYVPQQRITASGLRPNLQTAVSISRDRRVVETFSPSVFYYSRWRVFVVCRSLGGEYFTSTYRIFPVYYEWAMQKKHALRQTTYLHHQKGFVSALYLLRITPTYYIYDLYNQQQYTPPSTPCCV